MLTYVQSVLFIFVGMSIAWLLVRTLNKLWLSEERKRFNDVIGWQLGVLGTTYAVILGFMLYNVWTEYRAASIDVNNEAAAVLEAYDVSYMLPDPQRATLQLLIREYTQTEIDIEWPSMAAQRSPKATDAGEQVIRRMWSLLKEVKASGPPGVVGAPTAAVIQIAQRRRVRQEQYESHIPGLLWVLLVAGAVIVVVSSCILGNDNTWLHYCQVMSLTFIILVTLSAVADIDRPFEGGVTIDSRPFRYSLDVMNNLTQASAQ